MFPLIAILTILICAVPLCLAISFLVLYNGFSVFIAASVGIVLFVVPSAWIINNLVLKNNSAAS